MTEKSSRGAGCLILFSLPFAVVGLLVGFITGKMLWRWIDMQGWQEVPAHIIGTDLEVHTDDATTYEAKARYRYEYAGVTYEGDRVALGSGADNIGSFQQDVYDELSGYQQDNQPFRCFVDPDDPANAVLYREMRWGLFTLMAVFAAVFGGVGFGLIFAAFWARRRVADEEIRVNAHPEAPWLWREDWANGRIEASGKAQFILPAVFAFFWNLISFPLLFLLPGEILDKRNYIALIGLIFPLVGIGLLIWAGRAFVRWHKYGDSIFEMTTVPGVVGGRLTGRVLTSVQLAPAHGFVLTLSAIHRITSGSGNSRSTRETVLWQSESILGREILGWNPGRSEIPVDFRIPFESPPTEERSDDDKILWRLEVRAEVPGVDYDVLFEVPVFKTMESRPDPLPTAESEVWGTEPTPPLDLATFGIDSELLSTGGRRLSFRAARHKGPALGLTAFFLLWLGLNVLLFYLEAPIFFPLIWSLFSLLIFFGVLDLWFERRAIEIHPDKLVLAGGLFGLGKRQMLDRSQIRKIEPVRGMQSGNKLYYRIQVTTADNRKHIAATKLDNLSLARSVVEQLAD